MPRFYITVGRIWGLVGLRQVVYRLGMRRLFLILLLAAPLAAAPSERWVPAEKPWDRSLGSHRVVVKVDEKSAAQKSVAAHIEWRRPDKEPEKKAVLVYDLKTGKQVTNVDVESITNVEGRILFEPVSGAGEYAVYFLPAKIEGGAFPVGKYLPPQKTADEVWHKQHGSGAAVAGKRAPADVVRWEAITAHDGWNAFEVIATDAEVAAMAATWRNGAAMLVPEVPREVRYLQRLPRQLVLDSTRRGGGSTSRTLKAKAGEALVFPVVVWSQEKDLKNVRIAFGKMIKPGSATMEGAPFVCLNSHRVDWNGKAATVPVDVAKGVPQVLWYHLDLSGGNARGGSVVMELETDSGVSTDPQVLHIVVEGDVKDHGDADPQSLSRLRWLNSTTAVDDEPVKGYEPLTVNGRTIRCLGRELELGEDGLPVQIRSYFNKAVTKVMEKPQVEMLRGPIQFHLRPPAERAGGETRHVKPLRFTAQRPAYVTWETGWETQHADVSLTGRMEFDGSVRYKIAAAAKQAPVEFGLAGLVCFPASAPLMLGLQQESGLAPAGEFNWEWDVANKHQDSIWFGAVNAGLRLQLKAENYVRPSVNIHYKRRPLNDPPSWNAGGTGKMRWAGVGHGGQALLCTSGAFTLEPGKPIHFDFDLLITPFHTLRTKEQWSERYYHTGGVPQDYAKYLDGAKAAGANIVNIHQGNWLNPYINYPFLTADKLGAFAKAAHERGMRAKYYYTVRELSNWAPELFAFRSMGDEILMSGKGGGHPWGEEHLGGNYWGAWYEPGVQDVSYLTQPMSRLHNYYIEGLRWLCENAGCDGIYLDDISCDRAIMLRARKVLDRYCPRGGRIDLHSWNEFHEGGAWAHCANIFMDSFPFVDRIWFGEGHHYTGPPPEHFLVELSGIPFGLMGEMLEGGGNPWFGLVHGMTGRLGWQGNPTGVWQLWDDFGVQDAEFIGWWAEEECPVRCADPLVKATVWKKNDATLVAVANFSKEPKQAAMEIDWKALGRDPTKAKLYFPAISVPKQKASLREVNALPMLQPYTGAVFIIDEKPHDIAAPAAAEALGATLLDDDFSKGLASEWKPVISSRAKDAGKVDAGYVLQMPANLHGYFERSVPAEAGAVSARIWQDGKDEGQQWGPGLAIVWPDGKTLRANIRKDLRLTVSANGSENLDASATVRGSVEFTLRWDKDTVRLIAAGPAMGDLPEEIARFPRSQFPGQPSLLRVGKMPNSAGPQDHGDAGAAGFNRIEWVRIHAGKP